MLKKQTGFTLVELLVVIGVIAILAAVVLVAINPGRQFAQARDSQRRSNLYSISNAIYQFMAEHDGRLPDTDGDVTTSNFPQTATCIGDTAPCYNLAIAGEGAETVAPTYMTEMPQDPTTGSVHNTGYTVYENTEGRVVLTATGELEETIQIIR